MSERSAESIDDAFVVDTEAHDEKAEDSDDNIKTNKDGVALIPSPSDSPHDPLNWSWIKKHAVLFSLIPGCFMTDGVITYGTTLFPQQAIDWNMSVQAVGQSISGGVFMQGPGGLVAVPLCQRYGRLPVLFWSQFLSLVMSIGAAGSNSYGGFTTCRTLQGFFAAPPQVIGLSIIYDMFFFHERARKINIWAFAFLGGPYLSPLISAFLSEVLGWKENMWVLAGLFGFSTLTVVLLGDETLYDRTNPPERVPRGVLHHMKLLLGIVGAQSTAGRATIKSVIKSQVDLIARPYVLLPTFGFIMPLTMWTIGIVNTSAQILLPPVEAHGYGFTETQFALMFLSPMIGVFLAEIYGHFQNDFIANMYIRRHSGKFVPEVRLLGVYLPWSLGVGGLVLFGQALEYHLEWIAVAFGWAMQNFATLGTTTAISAYMLDIMPTYASLTAAWILQARVLGGFTVSYFQAPWVANNGPAVAFGCQAAIIGAAVFSILVTQYFGRRWRAKFPAPAALV